MGKDVILFVNAVRPSTFAALATFEEETGRTFEPGLLLSIKRFSIPLLSVIARRVSVGRLQ